MITIQSLLLVILGVLLAGLVALLVGPAYRRRVVRLTTEQIRQSMPVTEAEIRADKDRLRADYAIRIHRLDQALAEARMAMARQTIEINRRDAAVSALEGRVEELTARLEETENAKSVLTQTIEDRLPRVEHRLAEARKLLFQRDRDIAQLTSEAQRTLKALDEAMQMNAQQRAELARYQSSAVTRGLTANESLADPRFDAEVALRTEIEGLREKNRDQAALIARLQATLSGAAGALEAAQATAGSAGPEHAARSGEDTEIDRVKRDLERAAEVAASGSPAALGEARALRAKIEDQAAEISRLTAALAAYEAGGDDPRPASVRESRIAMKAKVSSMQAQLDQQAETIRKLRAEVAAGNERLARQAAHFMEEMRRLGAGTLPTAAPVRNRRETTGRRTLAERISQVNPGLGDALSQPIRPANDTSGPASQTGAVSHVRGRVGGVAAQIRALVGTSAAPGDGAEAPAPAVGAADWPPASAGESGAALATSGAASETSSAEPPRADAPEPARSSRAVPRDHQAAAEPASPAGPPSAPQRGGRLLQRIAELGKG